MEQDELRRRAVIAMRLKALRWLLGCAEPARNQLGYKVNAIPAAELAEWDGLRENGITDDLLGTIERMERSQPPMRLWTIAESLGLPRDYFTREGSLSVVSEPPEGGRPPGPPDELFPVRPSDQPKPDIGQGGRSRSGKGSRRGTG